jgi:NAD(P)-dependent dehydrogenase (short-subunit alcohol dehydrogenase family)
MGSETRARVAVVTGASSGIGLEAAKALAAAGWRVIGVGRDPGRGAAALAAIRAAAAGGRQPEMLLGDLALMRDAARLAREVAARTDRVDALLNNAGGVGKARVVTDEGNEATFAGNHLGHFLLTERLLPLLRTAAADQAPGTVRIVNVSSSGHEISPGLDRNDPQMLQSFTPAGAYCNAKLANILFTRALAKRVAADGLVAHAMHPGIVATNFGEEDEAMASYMASKRDVALSPQQGADTLVWLASAAEPGASNGGYFHNRAPAAMSAPAQDDAAAERLWTESEALIAHAGA